MIGVWLAGCCDCLVSLFHYLCCHGEKNGQLGGTKIHLGMEESILGGTKH